MRRVVVTGVGVVSSIGVGVEEFWKSCLEGRTHVESIPENWRAYSGFSSGLWSPLPELDYSAYGFRRTEQLQNDRTSLLAIVASLEALRRSGFVLEVADQKRNTFRLRGVDSERVLVSIGTGVGGVSSLLLAHLHQAISKPKENLEKFRSKLAAGSPAADELEAVSESLETPARMNPFSVPMAMPSTVSAGIGIKFSLTGPNRTYCSACAAGTVAIGQGYQSIRSGESEMALVGGVEFLGDQHGGIFRGFDLAGALIKGSDPAARLNRPFDEDRSGFLFSQGGSAILVLESLRHARSRGAEPLAEILGFAETCDAYSFMATDPLGTQIGRGMRAALSAGRVNAGEVDYLNAHGTGTISNDSVEASIIEEILGRRTAVNSTKSLLGHTLGASGAIEAVVTVLSILHQTSHVCLNLERPIAGLNFIREVAERKIDVALTHSFAFGGHNAFLVLGKI